jgi:hypothetical protein
METATNILNTFMITSSWFSGYACTYAAPFIDPDVRKKFIPSQGDAPCFPDGHFRVSG